MKEAGVLALIEESELFDAEWYKATYPEVASLPISASKHFYKYGWRLGRNPSRYFSTDQYLDDYPDVARAGQNPLLHFLRCGINEGRRVYTVEGGKPRQTTANIKMSNAVQRERVNTKEPVSATEVAVPKKVVTVQGGVTGDADLETVKAQLSDTQELLEKYYRSYQELLGEMSRKA